MSLTPPVTTGSPTPSPLVDEDLLALAGLADADPQTREEFATLMHHELEMRVGAALSEGVSKELLDLFAAFTDNDITTARAWLADHYPDYPQSPLYQHMAANLAIPADDMQQEGLVCEFAALSWMQTYRPDYRQVVAHHTAQLRAETIAILTNR